MSDVRDDEWLAWRRAGIGASDIAGILGVSPWESPYSVWAIKVGIVPDKEATEAMEMGGIMEPAINRLFHARTGLWVGGVQEWVQHPDLPWARATLDGRVYEHPHGDDPSASLGPLEAKTTSESPAKWENDIPIQYACQTQWQMFVTGTERTWVACLHAAFGLKFRVYEVERDDEDIAFIVERVSKFYTDHVLRGVPPETDAHAATGDTLQQLRADPGEVIDLADMATDWERLQALRISHAATAARIEALENAVKARMGSATEAFIGDRLIATWRPQERRTIDSKKLRAERPDIAGDYTKITTSRVFRQKSEKE